MSRRGEKTDEAGIYRLEDGRFRVLATAKDPETGKTRQRQRTLEEGQTMADAIEVRERLKAEIRATEDAPTQPRTVIDFAERWMERKMRSWKPSTASTYQRIISEYCMPVYVHQDGQRIELGKVPLPELDRRHVMQWADWASTATPDQEDEEYYATATVRKWWRHFRPLLKDLHAAGHTDRDLTDRVDPPTTPRRDARAVEAIPMGTLRDVVKCARELIPERCAELALLVDTGMRSSELWALHWGDVDFEESTVLIHRSISDGHLTPSTKTGSDRLIRVSKPAVEALEAHWERQMHEQVDGLAAGLCFPSTSGRPRTPGSLRYACRKIEQKLELEGRVSPQRIRKSVITYLQNEGVSTVVTQALVGHSTRSMQQHYFSANDQTRAKLGVLEGGDTG